MYKHTNTANGMVYIGMTGRKTNERWRNGEGYKHNEHFARAIEKYGWDGFKHEILWSGSSREEAERMEVELIALHKSDNREFGYNIESGGRLNVVSEETREKMRVAITGKKASEETRQKLSEAHKGKSAAWLDGEFRDEIKKKISDAKKARKTVCTGRKCRKSPSRKLAKTMLDTGLANADLKKPKINCANPIVGHIISTLRGFVVLKPGLFIRP